LKPHHASPAGAVGKGKSSYDDRGAIEDAWGEPDMINLAMKGFDGFVAVT
jgi:hypothetical protein